MSKQKQSKQAIQAAKQPSGIALAANWPVYEVLAAPDWTDTNNFTTILIARRSAKSGRVAAGSFLVDLACLGLKQTQVAIFPNPDEYRGDMRAHLLLNLPMTSIDFNLAAKIILTGINYAATMGFKPDAVFAQSEHLLAGAQPEANPTPVPTGGPEGKPLFINGPYDDVNKIINQLVRTVGEGNFNVVIQGPASTNDF
jgi:hypothetical protein